MQGPTLSHGAGGARARAAPALRALSPRRGARGPRRLLPGADGSWDSASSGEKPAGSLQPTRPRALQLPAPRPGLPAPWPRQAACSAGGSWGGAPGPAAGGAPRPAPPPKASGPTLLAAAGAMGFVGGAGFVALGTLLLQPPGGECRGSAAGSGARDAAGGGRSREGRPAGGARALEQAVPPGAAGRAGGPGFGGVRPCPPEAPGQGCGGLPRSPAARGLATPVAGVGGARLPRCSAGLRAGRTVRKRRSGLSTRSRWLRKSRAAALSSESWPAG